MSNEPMKIGRDRDPLPPWKEWASPVGHPEVLVAVYIVPEDAPEAVREGLVRRRIQALEGRCPCGRPGGTASPTHEKHCPAHDTLLTLAMEAWREGGGRYTPRGEGER